MAVDLRTVFTEPCGLWRSHKRSHRYGICLGACRLLSITERRK